MKSNKQFEKKKKYGTTVNFYNKESWLLAEINKELEKDQNELAKRDSTDISKMSVDQIRKKELVSLSSIFGDESLIHNCLRLEVQLGKDALGRFIDGERSFDRFLDIDFCRNIVIGRYEYFIGSKDADFYSYTNAKDFIDSNQELSITRKSNLLKYLQKLSRGLNAAKSGNYNHNFQLARLGIHYNLIPKELGIEYLPSPMKLMLDEINKSKDMAVRRVYRENVVIDESYLYNTMDVVEESVFLIEQSVDDI